MKPLLTSVNTMGEPKMTISPPRPCSRLPTNPLWIRLHFLAERFRLIRYDGRCNGLSDWNVDDVSIEAVHHDLETVVDSLGLRSYALLGISQGARCRSF